MCALGPRGVQKVHEHHWSNTRAGGTFSALFCWFGTLPPGGGGGAGDTMVCGALAPQPGVPPHCKSHSLDSHVLGPPTNSWDAAGHPPGSSGGQKARPRGQPKCRPFWGLIRFMRSCFL